MTLLTDKPENHALSSKVLTQFFAQMKQLNLQVNSFMLLQNGRATAQFWRPPYRKDSAQQLFSLSKTFTSIAVGIARDQGLLQLDDPVISFFPDKLPERISHNLAQMKIHHLLSMNAGHHENIYEAVEQEEDWVKAFLSLEVEHEPGSFYRYSTHSTYMLSAIIEKVTGQSLVDFLMPVLFEPLGISKPSWETCPLGITAGGMGLSLCTEDIAKFGLMLLNKGMYEGKRIVSEDYIQMATSEQSDNRAGAKRIDSAQGYGYQIHLCRKGCYRGDGSFGQLCFVAPNENIVIAATASFKSGDSLQTLLDLIYEHILAPLETNAVYVHEDYEELQSLLADFQLAQFHNENPSVSLLTDNGSKADSLAANKVNFIRTQISRNNSYTMNENPEGIHTIRFLVNDGMRELHLLTHDQTRQKRILPFDFSKPVHIREVFHKDLSMSLQEVVIYASWEKESTLILTLFYIETPYVVNYTIRFHEETVRFQYDINVSMNNKYMDRSAYSMIGKRNLLM